MRIGDWMDYRPTRRRAVAAARVAEGLRLGVGPGAAPEGQGVDAPARLRPGAGRARGVPEEGPELPARAGRPRHRALPGDGLPGRVGPCAARPRHRHLRPGVELLLRPRVGPTGPDGRRARRLRGGGVSPRRSGRRRWIELAKVHLRGGATSQGLGLRGAGPSCRTRRPSSRASCARCCRAAAGRHDPGISPSASSVDLRPESHFDRFERFLVLRTTRRAVALFVDGIRNEMPHETFLELAAWYHDLGRLEEARELLETGAAERRGALLARVRAGRAARPRGRRDAEEGRRGVAAPRLPVPVRERAGLRVGDAPDGQLAAEVLPRADSLEPQRPGARPRPAGAVRRRARLRAVLRGAGEGVRVGLARPGAGRPAARRRTRPEGVALRQAADRALHRGQGVRPGARHRRRATSRPRPTTTCSACCTPRRCCSTGGSPRRAPRWRRSTSCRTRAPPRGERSTARPS